MFRLYCCAFGLYFAFNVLIVSYPAHFTTNSNDLQNLFDYAKSSELVTSLAGYIETEEANIELLKHLSELLVYDESLKAADTKQFHHPRKVLEVIRRHALQLPVVVHVIRELSRMDVFDEATWNEFLSLMPNRNDLGFFIKGLVRIMDVYELKPETVSRGHILRHRSRGLNLDEIADIGFISTEYVLNNGIDSGGDVVSVIIRWLNLGSSLAKAADENGLRYKFEIALIEIARFRLRRANCQCSIDMEMAHEMWKKNNPGHTLPPHNWTCDANKTAERCSKNINKIKKEQENYSKICQHQEPVYFKERHIHLPVEYQYCKLDDNNHPWLKLQPLKVEIQSLRPYDMMEFHDLLSDNEIDYLKHHADGNMTRGKISFYDEKYVVSDRSVVEHSNLPREKHNSPVIRRILARLSAFSNLTMTNKTTGSFRLANYPMSGYVGSHLDVFYERPLDVNNTFVTFLLYLNDVDGGETVFPFLNIRVEARRGRGFMFTNTFRSGIALFDSRHMSCPVITGDKWIISHWVYRFGQEFSHKCSLNKYE